MSRKRHNLTQVEMGRNGAGKFPADSSIQLNAPRDMPVCNSTSPRDYRHQLSTPIRPGALDAFSVPSFAMGQRTVQRKPSNAA